MVNARPSQFENRIGGALGGLFFGDFGPNPNNLGVQGLDSLFQFGDRQGVEIFADNHASWLLGQVFQFHNASLP
jgi:hypothetical protein